MSLPDQWICFICYGSVPAGSASCPTCRANGYCLPVDAMETPRDMVRATIHLQRQAARQDATEIISALDSYPDDWMRPPTERALHAFVEAEVDLSVKNQPGPGRGAGLHFPRLADSCRNQLASMTPTQRAFAAHMVMQSICFGYAQLLIADQFYRYFGRITSWPPLDLESWASYVYSSGWHKQFPPEALDSINKAGEFAYQIFRSQLRNVLRANVGPFHMTALMPLVMHYHRAGIVLLQYERRVID